MVPASAPSKGASAEGPAGGEGTVALVPSSKKESSARRRELLAYLREPLREACASNAGELMRSKFAGALVLLETVRVSFRVSFSFFLLFCVFASSFHHFCLQFFRKTLSSIFIFAPFLLVLLS